MKQNQNKKRTFKRRKESELKNMLGVRLVSQLFLWNV